MNRTYQKIFRNKELLQEMLTLREKGWSYKALAIYFNCDHSSIVYQCRKHEVTPQSVRVHKLAFFKGYKLSEMLKLRKEGKSFLELSVKYDCRPETIMKTCKKYNVKPPTPPTKEKVKSYTDERGEPVNEGSSYKDLIKRENEKKNSFKKK
tara:strand:- start:237 stop:689 length:453 start_codon:yes stop_codon:yes gene_type:complete